jgi:F-type H+-transporting ATPase subunit b
MNALAASPVLAAGIMDLNPGLTLWTAITFILLIFVLGKYAFGPIVKMLDERERTIRGSIDEAKRERAEAEKLLAQQKEALQKAQREAAEIAKRNAQEMEVYRAQLTSLAKKESENLVASARKQIGEEKTKAIAELRAEVADLAIAAAARIVKSSLDEKTQRQLVEDYIRDLPVGRA